MSPVQDQTEYEYLLEPDFWSDLNSQIDNASRNLELLVSETRNRMLIQGIDFDMNSASDLPLDAVDHVYETEVTPDSWHLAPKNTEEEQYVLVNFDWTRTEKKRGDIDQSFDIQVYNLSECVRPGPEIVNELSPDQSSHAVAYIAEEPGNLPGDYDQKYEFDSGAEAVVQYRED